MNLLTKKQLTGYVAALLIAVAALFVPVTAVNAACTTTTGNIGTSLNPAKDGIGCAQGNGTPATLFGTGSIFTLVVNVLLFIIGAIAVIMLIWGGIRYTTSAGNAANVTAAKNTIMYAIIGLIIAFLAFAIVNWVLGAVNPGAGTTTP